MNIRGDQRRFNKGHGIEPKILIVPLNLLITPQMSIPIQKLISKGKFPNKSEFVRYCIARYLDEMKLW